jgi:hypothetical protein
MKDFDLRKYLAENKLLKEEIDVNKILSDGGYDIIDDEELLMTVKSRLKGKSNIDAEKLNLLVMKIEDEEGGNIDFTENKLLKENPGIFGTSIEDLPEFEYNFDNVKAAAERKQGFIDGEDSFQIETKFGVKQFDHFPNRTGNKVSLSTIGADDTRNTRFVSYDEAIEIIKDLT